MAERAGDPERGQKRRLVRRTDDKVVAGVCSGLGNYFDLDPLWFRIGFVVLALTGMTGIVLYLAAWALFPTPADPSFKARRFSPATLVGIGLAIVALAMVAPVLSAVVQFGTSPFGRVGVRELGYRAADYFPGPAVVALAFIGIGVLMLRQRDEGRGPLAGERPPPAAVDAGLHAEGSTATALGETVGAETPPTVRRQRSALPAFIMAATLLLVGGAALLSSAGIADIDLGQLTALALFVVGAGLIVGAWWGRARLMIALGLLMVPMVLVTSVVDSPLTGGFGGGYSAPRSQPELRDLHYTLGDVTLDLSEYRFAEGTANVDIRMDVGMVQVVIPRQVYARVQVDTRSGEATVFDIHRTGSDISIDEKAGDINADKRLNLRITGGLASVNVYRSPYGFLQRQDKRERRAERGAEGSSDRKPGSGGDGRADRPKGKGR